MDLGSKIFLLPGVFKVCRVHNDRLGGSHSKLIIAHVAIRIPVVQPITQQVVDSLY